ncbi:PEGA domain-containing protein [Chondromyces apiculatus]|uniref:PEGA domain-containing protein n=1 Tax=Chondromyces apiculatus DSM 436 TaxID=1192034 RepID=A0A017T553_9BACT|nr:PEGA domain-containing protein [Chondromyces apiculatus]EYF03686.1 Hypothetical protein CAP_5297 [Chondromyces apiculatus DSM 436]
MSDDKGGSDLDVFEGLAKKQPRSAIPGLTPPPPSQARQQRSTLMGGLGGLPPPPSMPTGAAPLPLPPPGAPPISAPPPAVPPASLPPITSPPVRASLPNVMPPPARPPTSTPLPPPIAGAPLPPVVPPPARQPSKTDEAPRQAKGKGGPAVDMDWDDEEESTAVYDKATTDGAGAPTGPRPAAGMRSTIPNSAAALLASSGGAAAAARGPTAGAAPGYHSAPPASGAHSTPPSTRRSEEATAVRPRPVSQSGGGSKAGIVLGGIALLAVAGLVVFQLLPKKGDLKIDVKAPAGVTIAKAEVFIDGQKQCDTVPCVVRGLEAGSKAVKVIAPDLPPQDATGVVEGSKESLVLVDFMSAVPAVTAKPAPVVVAQVTGVKIPSTQSGVKVFVDGEDKGTLPQEFALPPGSHKLRFEGGDRYEKREETVEVTQGQLKEVSNVALKVLKGQVTLELGTDGAVVNLVNTKGTEKRLPDTLWKTPPVKLDIDPSEGWRLVAKKQGYDDFTQVLSFDDGQAEKTVRIELLEAGKTPLAVTGGAPVSQASGQIPSTGSTSAPSEPKEPKEPKAAEPAPTAQASSGQGTLNINSIPVSKVVLDGRPLGSTPKVGVSVSAGSHTVIFIHPELGKKSVTVSVKGGETKTAAVKFK